MATRLAVVQADLMKHFSKLRQAHPRLMHANSYALEFGGVNGHARQYLAKDWKEAMNQFAILYGDRFVRTVR